MGYRRSDARIAEDVSDALMMSDDVDAGAMSVSARDGIVTLSGVASTRREKHLAEGLAEAVPGVCDVRNELRVGPSAPTADRPPVDRAQPPLDQISQKPA